MAAVRPAGPEPRITTSRTWPDSICNRFPSSCCRSALAPAVAHPRDQRTGDHEDSAEQEVARPYSLVEDLVVEKANESDDEHHDDEDDDGECQHSEDDRPDDLLYRSNRLVANRLDRLADLVGELRSPVVWASRLDGHRTYVSRPLPQRAGSRLRCSRVRRESRSRVRCS